VLEGAPIRRAHNGPRREGVSAPVPERRPGCAGCDRRR
jgi:hypothetical protein